MAGQEAVSGLDDGLPGVVVRAALDALAGLLGLEHRCLGLEEVDDVVVVVVYGLPGFLGLVVEAAVLEPDARHYRLPPRLLVLMLLLLRLAAKPATSCPLSSKSRWSTSKCGKTRVTYLLSVRLPGFSE